MSHQLLSISPVDGRYNKVTSVLSDYFSEYALIRYRVRVEVEYFIALCELPLPQLAGVPKSAYEELRKLYTEFSMEDAQHVKEIESVTNHDVKAVEYLLKEKLEVLGLNEYREFVHFGLTSQDINNTATPLLLEEVCRLRRESYKGVGIALDDGADGDTADRDGTYRQLVVWDRDRGEVVGGYRYAMGCEARVEQLSLNHYMVLSERFVKEYLPRGVELGRSFVSPRYQCGGNALTIYALDAIWEGLARIVKRESVEYLFGRVTLYDSLGVKARNLLVGYMRHASPVKESLMVARVPFKVGISRRRYSQIFIGDTAQENYRILLSKMRQMDCRIPPIISSYLRLSPTLKLFDSYRNENLGGVVESAIMLTISEFYDSVKLRYGL